jgi:hypothetical protein
VRPQFYNGCFSLFSDMLDIFVIKLISEGAGYKVGVQLEIEL